MLDISIKHLFHIRDSDWKIFPIEKYILNFFWSDEYSPKFNLIIIAFKGFPKEERIKECLRNNWKLTNNALEYFDNEIIDDDYFIRLLESYGLQASFYKKMKDLNL